MSLDTLKKLNGMLDDLVDEVRTYGDVEDDIRALKGAIATAMVPNNRAERDGVAVSLIRSALDKHIYVRIETKDLVPQRRVRVFYNDAICSEWSSDL